MGVSKKQKYLRLFSSFGILCDERKYMFGQISKNRFWTLFGGSIVDAHLLFYLYMFAFLITLSGKWQPHGSCLFNMCTLPIFKPGGLSCYPDQYLKFHCRLISLQLQKFRDISRVPFCKNRALFPTNSLDLDLF